MAGKTSLDFILNPTEPQVAGLLQLHKAAMAHSIQLLPSLHLQTPPRAVVAVAPKVGGDSLQSSEEKRFVPIRPKPSAEQSPAVSTDGESAADEEEEEEEEELGDEQDQEQVESQHLNETLPTLKKRRKTSTKKTRLCKEAGCTSLAVSRRSCVRHGGGSRCVVDGCNNGAKLRNRCFQHGGSTVCLADGCDSKAKRYGYCWCHGGGRICSTDDCNKVAAQRGLCWAHGGGNRCKLDGCTKRSYQKHGYFCKRHAMYNSTPADAAVSTTAP